MSNIEKMTPKQEQFIQEYLVDGNASAAARRAKYSSKTAGAIGERLLKKAEIKEALEKAAAERNARHEISLERILTGLLREAQLPKNEGGTSSVRVAAWRAIADIGGFTAPQRIELDAAPLAARLEAAKRRLELEYSVQIPPPIPPEIPRENRENIAGRT